MGLLRKAGAVAVAASGFGLARSVRRKRPWIEANVAPDLRTPLLYAVPPMGDARSLPVVRAMTKLLGLAGMGAQGAERVTGDGVRVVVYEPATRDGLVGGLVWIHGGGMVLGSPDQSDEWCRRVRDEVGVVVVSVDYRLAPEHPFPAPVDDCTSALRWLHEQADALGVDPARIAVGGDSAGGGLTASVCQRALDEGGPAIAFQLLVYPMLDDRTVLRTDLDPEAVYLWSPASNRFGWTSYLGHEISTAPTPPHAVPARRDDLAGLPPAWLGVGSLDLFLDEDLDYARRLEEAGVPCELHVAEGMWHGADSVMAASATGKEFRQRMIDALAGAIGSVPARELAR